MAKIKKPQELMNLEDHLWSLTPQELTDTILSHENRQQLDYRHDGTKRAFPMGKVANNIKQHDYQMSDKQRYSLVTQYAKLQYQQLPEKEPFIQEMKVVGTTFRKVDGKVFESERKHVNGTTTSYPMRFALQPEPDNQYDPNAVKVIAKSNQNEAIHIGYLPKDFVADNPITNVMLMDGEMKDFSNGKFKNLSFIVNLDISQIKTPEVLTTQDLSDLQTKNEMEL